MNDYFCFHPDTVTWIKAVQANELSKQKSNPKSETDSALNWPHFFLVTFSAWYQTYMVI
jgi:hypothetical protein